MSTCSKCESQRLEQLLWMDGTGTEAFFLPLFPSWAPGPAVSAGLPRALVHTQRHRGGVWCQSTGDKRLCSSSWTWESPLSELASEQVTEDNRPNDHSNRSTFSPLFARKGTCLNREWSEIWLGLSLSGLLLLKSYPLRVARSWQSEWMPKKKKKKKRTF